MPPEPSTTPPSNPDIPRRRSLLAAALVTATWVACVIATDGMLDLLLDLPPLHESGVGALFETAVITFSAALLFLRLFVGVRPGGRATALLAVDALLLTFFGAVLASAFGVAMERRSLGAGLLAVVREASALGTGLTAIIAAACALLFAWLVARSDAGVPPPRWPWDDGPADRGATE